jgi:hypothetical protein
MQATFPEVPTGALTSATGEVDLLIGQNNYRLFPVEKCRIGDAALHESRFGTGWIASEKPL